MKRIFRLPAVLDFSGYSKSQLQEKIKEKQFPQPVPMSDTGRAVGWLEEELLEWRQSRIAARDATPRQMPAQFRSPIAKRKARGR